MERDDETGLGYHSQRYYCPWLGRWTRPDPIGVRGGVNLWVYGGGDPLGSVDLRGTEPKSAPPRGGVAKGLAFKKGKIVTPDRTVVNPPSVSEEESSSRHAKSTAASRKAGDAPVAASLMAHWLGDTGSTINLSDTIDITDAKYGIVQAALAVGMRKIEAGIRSRLDGAMKSDLVATGEETIYREDSARIKQYERSDFGVPTVVGPEQLDMSVALGGFTFRLEVDVELVRSEGEITGAAIVAGRLQIVDRYDWNVGPSGGTALAQIPVPSGFDIGAIPEDALASDVTLLGQRFVKIKDDWFSEIEAAGLAENFVVTSDVVDVTDQVKKEIEK